MEYRYHTGLAGSLLAGALALCAALLVASGPLSIALVLSGIAVAVPGLCGLAVDARGVLRSAGKRIVVTDEEIEEVDEYGRVVWLVRPSEVRRVGVQPGRPVFPLRRVEWRSEAWELHLSSGSRIRIPVWLLPGRGARFGARFAALYRDTAVPEFFVSA